MPGAKCAVQLRDTSDVQEHSAPKPGAPNGRVVCEQALSPIADTRTTSKLGQWLRSSQLWIVALLALLIGLNAVLPVLSPLDRLGSDALLARHAQGRVPPGNIVLVNIDQASLDSPQMLELAGNWPWARVVHGELVTYLAQQGARALVFDVSFSEPDVFNLGSDQAFGQAIAASPMPVYLPLVIAQDGVGSPLADLPAIMGITPGPQAQPQARLPLLAPKALPPEVWRTGHINFLVDSDQVGRRADLYRLHQGWQIPSLAGRVAADLGWARPSPSEVVLNWYGQDFQTLSYQQVLLAALSSKPPDGPSLAGKIVIVGSTAPGLVDFRPTPMGSRTPGPAILATTLANLQQADGLVAVNAGWSGLLAGVFVLLSIWGAKKGLHPGLLGLAAVVLSLLAVALAYALLGRHLQWSPFSAIAIGFAAQISLVAESFWHEKRQRQQTVQLFNRFLDPHVVQQLTRQSSLAEAEVGRSQSITVLFSDIRGFTTLSETRAPEEIVQLLNRYFDQQVEVIFRHQGTLDKFIGDAIMAFWGAPIQTDDHAVRAVAAALDMGDTLEAFARELDYPFEIGIGLHTGKAVVGLIGSSRRLDYTAIGDAVNLASRIEGQTKGIARILVSESTRLACGDAFEFIDHQEFAVKGRAQSVRLFEPRRTS